MSNIEENVVINDPIYGSVVLNKICLPILNHPYFQRLRNIQQLGLCSYVYPSGNHSRFEHSVGTFYLADRLIRTLKDNCSDYAVTDDEIYCVGLAGLCHDLGHGPFSHLWEKFLKTVDVKFHHEENSLRIFQSIVETADNNSPHFDYFRDFFTKNNKKNLYTVMKLIWGAENKTMNFLDVATQELIQKVIPKERNFLLEIVNNSRTGFDVDRWDYLNRDSARLGLGNNFDSSRQMNLIKILPLPDGSTVLALRDKQVQNFVDLLNGRRKNHALAYQHKKTVAFETMLVDALEASKEHFMHLHEDLKTFGETNDILILHQLRTVGSDLTKSLMTRLDKHNNYKYLATAKRSFACGVSITEFMKKLDKDRKEFNDLKYPNVLVTLNVFDFGSKTDHPLENMYYYSKNCNVPKFCKSKNQSDSPSFLVEDLQITSGIYILVLRLYSRRLPKNDAEVKELNNRNIDHFKELCRGLEFESALE